MKKNKFGRMLSVSLRNFIIFILTVLAVVFITEAVLRVNAEKNIATEEMYNQNMQEKYFRSEATEYSPAAKKAFESFFLHDFDFSGYVPEHEFPLITLPSTEENKDDAKNIVIIGDSFIWGDGTLNRNEMFWKILENNLRSEGYNCNIYPVGMAGAGSKDELQWLKDTNLTKELKPDLVIFGFVRNDADTFDCPAPEPVKEITNIVDEVPFLSFLKKFIPATIDRVNEYLGAKTMYNMKYGRGYRNNITVLKGPVLDKYKKDFIIPLDEYASSADFPIVLMTLPAYPDKTFYSNFYKPLHEMSEEYKNFYLYDCIDDFCKFAALKHAGNYFVSNANPHPGTASNKFYADYIEDFIKKDFSDILVKNSETEKSPEKIFINEWLPFRITPELISADENTAEYKILYPSEIKPYEVLNRRVKKYFLDRFVDKDYVMVSFETPVDLKKITLSGENLIDAEIYYTYMDKSLGYDDHTVKEFGKGVHQNLIWTDKSRDRITSLCIHAEMKNSDGGEITITMEK